MSFNLFDTIPSRERFPGPYAWFPLPKGGETWEDQGRESAWQWLEQTFSPEDCVRWKELLGRGWRVTPEEMLRFISHHNSGAMVSLLYSRCPNLFLKGMTYRLSPELFPDWVEPPFSQKDLQLWASTRAGCLNAACLFALCGADDALHALLERGADPDGLDNPEGWSYLTLPDGKKGIPLCPMDCAILSKNENCQMVLELFGARSLQDHLQHS